MAELIDREGNVVEVPNDQVDAAIQSGNFALSPQYGGRIPITMRRRASDGSTEVTTGFGTPEEHMELVRRGLGGFTTENDLAVVEHYSAQERTAARNEERRDPNLLERAAGFTSVGGLLNVGAQAYQLGEAVVNTVRGEEVPDRPSRELFSPITVDDALAGYSNLVPVLPRLGDYTAGALTGEDPDAIQQERIDAQARNPDMAFSGAVLGVVGDVASGVGMFSGAARLGQGARRLAHTMGFTRAMSPRAGQAAGAVIAEGVENVAGATLYALNQNITNNAEMSASAIGTDILLGTTLGVGLRSMSHGLQARQARRAALADQIDQDDVVGPALRSEGRARAEAREYLTDDAAAEQHFRDLLTGDAPPNIQGRAAARVNDSLLNKVGVTEHEAAAVLSAGAPAVRQRIRNGSIGAFSQDVQPRIQRLVAAQKKLNEMLDSPPGHSQLLRVAADASPELARTAGREALENTRAILDGRLREIINRNEAAIRADLEPPILETLAKVDELLPRLQNEALDPVSVFDALIAVDEVIHKSTLGTNTNVTAFFEQIRQNTRIALGDTGAFGGMADFYNWKLETRRALKPAFDAMAPFNHQYEKHLRNIFEYAKSESNRAVDMGRALDGMEDVFRRFEDPNSSVLDTPIDVRTARNELTSIRESFDRHMPELVLKRVDNMIEDSGALRASLIPISAAFMSGQIGFLWNAAAQIFNKVVDPIQITEVVARMSQKQTKSVSRMQGLGQALRETFSSGNAAKLTKELRGTTPGIVSAILNNPNETLPEMRDTLTAYLQDPVSGTEGYHELTAHMHPSFAEALVALEYRTGMMLLHTLPTFTTNALGDIQVPPSPFEVDEYAEIAYGIADPVSILADLVEGEPHPSKINAVKAVHTEMFNNFEANILQNMAEDEQNGIIYPHEMRVRISRFTNLAIEPSMEPSFVQLMQSTAAQTPAQAAAQGAGRINRANRIDNTEQAALTRSLHSGSGRILKDL